MVLKISGLYGPPSTAVLPTIVWSTGFGAHASLLGIRRLDAIGKRAERPCDQVDGPRRAHFYCERAFFFFWVFFIDYMYLLATWGLLLFAGASFYRLWLGPDRACVGRSTRDWRNPHVARRLGSSV